VDTGNPLSVLIGFGAESFYWSADATVTLPGGGTAMLIMATEAAYAPFETPTAGMEQVFNRIRVRLTSPTLAGTYNITHPYGTATVVVPSTGQTTTVTTDLGCLVQPGVIDACANANPSTPGKSFFSLLENPAAGGLIGAPWLTLVGNPITPANGKNYISGTGPVVGSPTANNIFRVVQPDAAQIETPTFSVTGVMFAPLLKEITPVSANASTNNPNPSYTFNVAGLNATDTATVSYGGACSSATTSITGSGDKTIVLTAVGGGILPDATYNNCTITVTDDVTTNASAPRAISTFTVDTTAPVVAEVTPIASTTNDSTPNYVFNSNEAGAVTVGGDCSSATTTTVAGNKIVTFNKLAMGLHSNCTVTITDAALNVSTVLAVPPFTVDILRSPIFRFWSNAKQGHFFTANAAERASIIANDPSWADEGTAFLAFNADEIGITPVYRFWSATKKHHFFTVNAAERADIIANDKSWADEGIAYYAFATQQPNTTPVFRFWSNAKQGHFFTTNAAERADIIANDKSWADEGIAYFVPIN
jgi:hypothetical protein